MNSTPFSAPDWRTELRRRLGTLWLIKSLGTICWIASFFTGYFWVLRNPLTPAFVMPLTPLDRLVPFSAESLVLYASLWLYVSLAPALVKNFRELFSYGVATLVLSAIGLAIFLYLPTVVPASDVQFPVLSMLRGVDLAGNACPSLHVAFAVFTGLWLDRIAREMGARRVILALNWLWCVGIVYSTLATRQHVVLDVVAGALLGYAVARLHMRALAWAQARLGDPAATPAVGRLSGF
jgi:membrane-associated phospholipid phosphatase